MKRLLLFLLLLPVLLPAQQVTTKIAGYNAHVYTPKGYSTTNHYPVLICVPGNGEVGTNDTLLNTFLPCKFIAAGTLAPNEIVVCVQPLNQWPNLQWLKQMYDSIARRWSVDLTRVYLTGYSAGGTVCDQFAVTYPNLVAGLFSLSSPPMQSGPVDAPLYIPYAAAGGHAWMLTGSNDNSNQFGLAVSTMNAAAPGSAIYTEIPGMGHCCWDTYYSPAYTLNGFNAYNWLLQWSQPRAIAPPPLGNKRIVLGTGDVRYPQVYYTNVASQVNPQPGDTLVIPTGIHSALLSGFAGTPTKPIVIIPADSGWIGGYTDYAFTINNANYFTAYGFHIDGKDSSNGLFAIKQLTSNYTVHDLSLKNGASEGIQCKWDQDTTNPATYYPPNAINNVTIYNVRVQNCTDEMVYLGNMNDVIKPLAAPFVNLTLYNISTDSSGRMGIILSDIESLHAHDLSINRFGIMNIGSYQNGLAIGQDVTIADSMYNVKISNGTGAGILDFGRGLQKLRNFTITNTATTAGQDVIYIDDRPDLGYNLPPLQLDFSGFTISGGTGKALNVLNTGGTMLPGMIANFKYSGTGQGIFDQVDKIITPAIPVTPVPVKTIKSLLITYSDGSTETKP